MNHTAICRSVPAALLLSVCLAACSGQSEEGKCSVKGENFLIDPQFSTLDKPRRERQWHSSEHGATKSFNYSLDQTALVIEQVGTESWAIVVQSADAKALAGKTVQFSAELKLDLSQPALPHKFKLGGGLLLSAKRNGKTLLSSTMDHEPHMGVTDWITVNVAATIPPRSDYVQIGFIHQAGGTMKIRNPSVREIDSLGAECALSAVGN